MSTAADREELLSKLRGLEKGTTLDQALAILRPPEPASVIEARRRCALVRAFDKDVYAELTRDLPDAPALSDFVAGNDVRRQGPERWAFDELSRNALLRAWKLTDTDLRNWNSRLAKFFLARNRPEERLDALYHLAASMQPDDGAAHFEKWYAEADANFDLAQCNALLEILRVREATRGPKLTRAWNDYRQFYQARQLFGDDYYKTGAYFEREAPLEKFEALLKDGSKEWIYHVHATGGTGKTMFLRWLAARFLVPKHIPCARIDFDDFPLSGVLEYPNRIFTRIIDQLASQVPGGVLTALREKLQRELESPGWNTSVPEEIGRQLRGAKLDTHLVVMLDTLEDVTRTAKVWLKTCLQTLRRLHELHPKLIVVLSGRYNIAEHTNALLPGEAVVYELQRFSEEEADSYLATRGIPAGKMRKAIVLRAGENAELDDDKLAGRNPFKLAMFAELALNKSGLTAEIVRNLPRVDIAYLIQRVIMRIPSQPLRWAIRYGVVVRHLTKPVIEAVLLPELKEALRGKALDDPNAQLGDEFGKVWVPDPGLAETITADEIWNDLKTYVRERGWISLSGNEADGTEELRFHPEVVAPTRELLRDQAIYIELQRRAGEFFHAQSGLDDPPGQRDAQADVRNACEAVFHRFQVYGPAARDYWHSNLRQIEQRYGLESAVRYAGEICGSAFASAQVEPTPPFMSAAVLREAHCEVADLLLQTITYVPEESSAEFTEFQRQVEWAKAVAKNFGLPPVPRFLVAIHDAASAKTGRAIEALEDARKQSVDPREQLFLTLVLARRVRVETPRDSARYLEQALPILKLARRVEVNAYSLAFELKTLYQSVGDHAGVLRALKAARVAAGEQRVFLDPVDHATAQYSLDTGDLETAAACIERLQASSVFPRIYLIKHLRAQLALERGEVLHAISLVRDGLAGMGDLTDQEDIRADFHALEGVAHKTLLAYSEALDSWERAGVVYDHAGSADGAARSALLAAQLAALELSNIHDALSLVDGATQLRGAQSNEFYTEFQLVRAYAAYRGGNPDAARELIPDLRRRCASEHPQLRARVALFEIVFGLETQERRHLELLETIQTLEPLSARKKLLKLCGYSEATLTLTPRVQERIRELFGLATPDSSVHTCLGRAHMFRLMGERDCAEAVLRGFPVEAGADVLQGFFVDHWLIQRALRRLGVRTDFRKLLKLIPVISSAEGLLNAWGDGLLVESALEAVRAGDLAEAEAIGTSGVPFAALAGQLQVLWLSRIEEVQHYALEHLPPGSRAKDTAERFEAIGDLVMAELALEEWRPFASKPQMAGAEPPETPESPPPIAAPMPLPPAPPPGAPPKMSERPSLGTVNERPHGSLSSPEPANESLPSDSRAQAEIQIGTGGLPDLAREALNSNENAIDILLGRWKELADQLSDRLKRDLGTARDTLVFEVAPQAASLPWELAPLVSRCNRYWRKNSHARAPSAPSTSRVDRVLLVRPRQGSGDISLESASGGSLESLYTFRHRAPDFHVLFDPDPEMLMDALQRLQPTILHINAVMRELQGGVFLDFESTESRADERGARHGAFTKYAQSASVASERRDLVWSTTRLGRTLQSAPVPVTTVLDIAASPNITETIRMLLLRNQYANQLFQFAPMYALLGVGLAAESERFDVTRAMIDGLLAGGAFSAIRALRVFPIGKSTPGLEDALPRFAPAIWAHDARAGVFES